MTGPIEAKEDAKERYYEWNKHSRRGSTRPKISDDPQYYIMKNKILTVTYLSIVALAVGCEREKTASQQIDKIQTETKAATQDMKDYTFAQKAEFVTKMQGQVDVLNK